MSKNLTIQETGVAKKLSAISEIETAEQGGGSITWVPEGEHKVMKKTITAKGKYKAKDDNVYAYSEVVVNLSGSAKAKDKDKKPFTTIAPDITIQEGGVGKKMYNVKKLSVSVTNSDDTCSWVPEDNVKTDTLSVSGNGTFKASEHGCYGWTEVTVSKKAKEIIHKDDGNDYAVYEDDTEEKIASSIKVTTPPDKTTYIAYEPINTTGMVVTAYYGDGTEYGVVEDWRIDPLVATSPSGEDEYIIPDHKDSGSYTVTDFLSPLDTLNAALATFESRGFDHYELFAEELAKYDSPCEIFITDNMQRYQGYSPLSAYIFTDISKGDTIELGVQHQATLIISYGSGSYPDDSVCPAGAPINVTKIQVSQTVASPHVGIDGRWLSSIDVIDKSKEEDITVIWTRPEDETELTDTFKITVNDPTPII